MSCLNAESCKSEDLSYSRIQEFHDHRRFYQQDINGTIYLYDQRSADLYQLDQDLVPFLKVRNEFEFLEVLSRFSGEERDLNLQYLTAILEAEEKPVQQLKTKTEVSHVKLNLHNRCNLNCSYCFRQQEEKQPLNKDMVRKVLDYILFEIGRDAQGQSVGIDLTAEPLLDPERLLELKSLVDEAARKDPSRLNNIGFFFISNGTLAEKKHLKAVKKTRNEPYIHISIDGPKDVHDTLRRTAGGQGTYDTIVGNLLKFRKKGLRLKAEGVLTRLFPHPMEVALHLMELGFERINLKTVRPGTEHSFTADDLSALKAGYTAYFEHLTAEILQGQFGLLSALRQDHALRYLPWILKGIKIDRRCFWGVNSLSVDGKGDFYPCDSAMGVDALKVGNVDTGMDWDAFHRDVGSGKRGSCSSCWARNLCGGTCYVSSYYQQGNIMAIDSLECSMNKFLVEQNLKMVFRLMDAGIDLREMTGSFWG